MKVLITGADGFIGKNLNLHLSEKGIGVLSFTRKHNHTQLLELLNDDVDCVFHLAGVNRPQDPTEFAQQNTSLTQHLCDTVCNIKRSSGKSIPIIFTSSIQATQDNPYGKSKRAAEAILLTAAEHDKIPVHIFRLPNIFGKWCRPHYNSVIATFCHNIIHNIPIDIHDSTKSLTLVYIDDVIKEFLHLLEEKSYSNTSPFLSPKTQYNITLGELAHTLTSFKKNRENLIVDHVGHGLIRALYATYLSYLPPQQFSYPISAHSDPRGLFAEMVKTPDSGQVSFFTAHPGITRGGHYHHTKNEKFLVVRGKARFRFRHIDGQISHELITSSEQLKIVETIPGWAHDITNIGNEEMIVMLWANELFTPDKPDTFAQAL